MGFMIYLRKTISVFFEYDTPRYVHINSKKVGIFSRLIQLVILSYIVGYVLVYQKGYQDTCLVDSTVVTKVKGVIFTNYTKSELNVPHPELYNRIWDSSDYVAPPEGGELGGFFIMTNVVITPNQTRGQCPEDPKVIQSICFDDTNCKLGRALEVGNGVQTGKCLTSARDPDIKTCEIFAWCPIEQDILPLNSTQALLEESKYFTILIKNTIAFPKFGPKYQRRNIPENVTSDYLQQCNYHKITDPFCPVFKLNDIIESFGGDGEFNNVAIKGGVFVIRIKWNCNLDMDFIKYCRPNYEFQRMDNPNALIAPGWNFRFANYHEENKRTLFKKYGLKFNIEVEGQAGKFSIIPLLLNVGSGLALMGLATILCDIIVLYCLKNGDMYKEKKYLYVRGDDAFDVHPNLQRRNYTRFIESDSIIPVNSPPMSHPSNPNSNTSD